MHASCRRTAQLARPPHHCRVPKLLPAWLAVRVKTAADERNALIALLSRKAAARGPGRAHTRLESIHVWHGPQLLLRLSIKGTPSHPLNDTVIAKHSLGSQTRRRSSSLSPSLSEITVAASGEAQLRRERERGDEGATGHNSGSSRGGPVARCDGVVVAGGRGPRPFTELRQGRAARDQPGLGLQLLRQDLPQRGVHRPQRHQTDGRRQPRAAREASPSPLPRLLRQWLRRVDPAGRGKQREDGRAQPVGGRLRGDRRDQDAAGADLPGRGLLRRHRRAGGARRRLGPVPVVAVAGGDGPARRHRLARLQHGRAPLPVRGLQRPPPELHQPRAQPHRPRRAVGGPHHRRRQLHQRHRPAVQRERHRRGPAPGLGVRADADDELPQPVHLQSGHHRQPRRHHAGEVRQHLLRQRAAEAGDAGLRRRAPVERAGRADGRRPHQPHQVLRRLLHVHEEDGAHRRAHRNQGADQEAVPPGWLLS